MNYLEREPGHDISSLRLVVCGGSAVPMSLMKTFEERHGVDPAVVGMTETSPTATLAQPPPGTPTARSWEIRGRRAGRCAAWRPASSTTRVPRCPTTARPSASLEVRAVDHRVDHCNTDESKFQSGWLRTGDVGRIDPQGYIP